MYMKSTFLKISIGRKILVGVTGIGLALFVLMHMLGNLLLFVGEKPYNMYSDSLIHNPLLIFFEIGLLILFFTHIFWALFLTVQNYLAKGVLVKDSTNSLIHKTLWLQGVVIFIFVILHLITFKYGTYYHVEYDGKNVRNLFLLVSEVFQKPSYVIWYIFCLLALFTHLNHGLQASLRSLGFDQESLIQKAGLTYSLIVTLGFISQPLYFLFLYGN